MREEKEQVESNRIIIFLDIRDSQGIYKMSFRFFLAINCSFAPMLHIVSKQYENLDWSGSHCVNTISIQSTQQLETN